MPDLWFYDTAEDELPEDDDDYQPSDYVPEDIDDRWVVATQNEAGAWRIKVAR